MIYKSKELGGGNRSGTKNWKPFFKYADSPLKQLPPGISQHWVMYKVQNIFIIYYCTGPPHLSYINQRLLLTIAE